MVTEKQLIKAKETIIRWQEEEAKRRNALESKVYMGIRTVLHKTKYASLNDYDVSMDFSNPKQIVITIKDR